MEDREKLLSTEGIWQGLYGGKISSGRGCIKGIPRRENLNKGTEARKSRPHFGEQCVGFDYNIVYMSGNNAQRLFAGW